MGPHDRYNFGDLLFELIVSRLLIQRAGYLPHELVSVGMIHADMSQYGGNPNIGGAKTAVDMSHRETHSGNGPFDIVFLGGEAIGCSFDFGKSMISSKERKKQAESQRVSSCAYLMPKERLVPMNSTITAKPVAIVNSAGANGSYRRGPCKAALDAADFIAFRDLESNHSVYPHAQLRPDCAVMMNDLFHEEITSRAESGKLAELIASSTPYIAVQLKKSRQWDHRALTKIFDEIWRHTNYTTVSFLAGSAPGHDSIDLYNKVAKKMKGPSIIFDEEHVWSVVALISRASAVVSTSLHVRIMAFVYQQPRVTICSESKHRLFVNIWDATDASPCVPFHNYSQTVWPTLKRSLQTPMFETEQAVERAIQSYLEGFDQWSSMLNQ